MNRVLALIGLLSLGGLLRSHGADAASLWGRKVQPLFDVQCVKCHGPIERKSGLELDSPESVLKGGDEGPVVVPGEPDKSRLYQYLAADADPHMPPKKQLTDAERAVVREWITAMVATTDRGSSSPASRAYGAVNEAIDAWMADGWKEFSVKPVPGLDDRTWCRRVYLDLAGRIPTAEEVKAFLETPADWRRRMLVEQRLVSEEYAVRMRELWDVFLMGRTKRDAHEDRRRQNGWWAFLERAFHSNRPWDQTVRDLLTGRPANPADKGAAWFLFERRNDYQVIAEAVAPLVYGTKIDCAQCHDHPLAREVKQAHYWGLVAAYNRGKNIDGTGEVAESAIGGFVNFTNLRKESQSALITLLNGQVVEETRPGPEVKEEDRPELYWDAQAKVRVPKFSRRESFARAATADPHLLARAFVNRMWAVLMGRGLVHPADEMTARNVPSHPELLEWLANDFVAHQCDVRRLVRGMVLSRVYALGWRTGESTPPEAFAGAIERPLTAEQMARSWRVAVGLPPNDDTLRRAVTAAMPDVLPREYNATFQQAQFLTYSPGLADLFRPVPGGVVERLQTSTDAESLIRGAYESVLGRSPSSEEIGRVSEFLAARKEDSSGVRDLLWALMTSAEFLTAP